jgi:hypothetical protein
MSWNFGWALSDPSLQCSHGLSEAIPSLVDNHLGGLIHILEKNKRCIDMERCLSYIAKENELYAFLLKASYIEW